MSHDGECRNEGKVHWHVNLILAVNMNPVCTVVLSVIKYKYVTNFTVVENNSTYIRKHYLKHCRQFA